MHHRTRQLQLASAAALSAFLFLLLVILRMNTFFVKENLLVSARMLVVRNDGLTRLLVIFTEIFSVPFMSVFVIGICFVLLWHDRKLSYRFISAAFLACALTLSIKAIVHAVRPQDALLSVSGWSFPSGHAALAVVLFTFLAVLFEKISSHRIVHLFFNVWAAVMIVGVSFSRLYLGVHWLDDVLGGMLLGVFATSFVTLLFMRKIHDRILRHT